MSKAVTGKIERSGQKGQFSEIELRSFVQSSRKAPAPLKTQTKQQRDAVTAAAYKTLEMQAAINRGVKLPTVSEHREKLRKLETRASITDSKMARFSNR